MNTSIRRNSGSARTPLLCLIAAVGGAGAMFLVSQKDQGALQAQLAELREQIRRTEAKTADPKEVERLRAQAREAAELKKEVGEVHRLRGEVTQLQQDKTALEKTAAELTQLRRQAQTAQRLQAELTALRAQHLADLQMLQPAPAPVAVGGLALDLAHRNSCIANLKQIDGATQQWALETRKLAKDPVDWKGIQAYLLRGVLPVCPGGGVYQPGVNVSASPSCSVPGHKL